MTLKIASHPRVGHMWRRIPRKWDEQKDHIYCRLVDVNSSSVLRRWCREGRLYTLCGLYMLPVDARATRHYLLRCMTNGRLFVHTNK